MGQPGGNNYYLRFAATRCSQKAHRNANIRNWYKPQLEICFVNTPEAEVQRVLNKAWELGIRYYDTAPWYGPGLSEHRLGSLLRQHKRKK